MELYYELKVEIDTRHGHEEENDPGYSRVSELCDQ